MPILIFLLLFCPFAVAAPSSDVPARSGSYQNVDDLEAFRCGYSTYRLFRPQAYADLRSTVDVQEGNPEEGNGCKIPRWLRKEKQILMMRPAQSPSIHFSLLAIGDEPITLRGLEATIAPSFPLWDRRGLGKGVMSYTDFAFHTQGGGEEFGVAFGLTPSLGLSLMDSRFYSRFYLYEAYAKLAYKWAELEIAREVLQFGNAAHGSLLLSGATSPITFARFGFRPHVIGSPLSFLGPTTFQLFVTTETGSKLTPGAHLMGVHLGFRPFTWFEFALLELYQFNGPGINGLGLTDLMKMLFYIGDADLNLRRQKQLATHLGFHITPAIQFYFQFAFDSLGPVSRWFADDASWLVGLWLANLGKLGIRLEYVQTVPSAYQAAPWKSGLVYDGTPVGHPLGPDAEGIYVDLHFPDIKEWRPDFGVSYEKRGRHPTLGQGTDTRFGAMVGISKRWIKTEFSLQGKIAHVDNLKSVLGAQTEVAGAQFTIQYHFL